MIHLLLAGIIVLTVPKVGQATWYGKEYQGREMAYGGRFDRFALTCASWDYPKHAWLRVTNLENGRSVVVQVTDRGPRRDIYAKGVLIDLSEAAFAAIAPTSAGHVRVSIVVVDTFDQKPTVKNP